MRHPVLTRRRVLAATAALLTSAMITVGASSATAFGPSTLYSSPSTAYKYGALYPKTVELQHSGSANGTLLATHEQTAANGNGVFPIYRSTNNGATWSHVSDIADTHDGIGNNNGAFLYELPQQIGSLAAGTVLAVGLASTNDYSQMHMEVYKSTDQGATWSYLSRIASGAGSDKPIWEPFVLVANGKLIVYYSDERDKAAHNQKIVHQTSTNGVTWSSPVDDVAATDSNLRPGMPVVSKLADGRYLMSYEVVNASGLPNNFKISSDPESWNAPSLGTTVDHGGSPYNIVLPNGKILWNSYGSADVLVNTNNGTGGWTAVKVKEALGYSRTLQYVHATGRVLIVTCAGFFENGGNNKNVITYGDEDFGSSVGAYYKLVNRASGKVLGVDQGALADGANAVQWNDTGAADQAWHMTTNSSGQTVFGNRASGRALGIYQGSTTNGASAVQWLDSGAADQRWKVVQSGSYVKIQNVNSGELLGINGGSKADGAQVVQWPDDGSLNQQWQVVKVSS